MTQRIPPATPTDDETTEALAATDALTGRRLNIFATMANNPRLLRRYVRLGGAFLMQGTLPARERELVILRVGRNARSPYEIHQHLVIGKAAGLSDDEMTAITSVEPATPGDGWSTDDATLLAATDEVCTTDNVSDETWGNLKKRWSDSELVELLLLVGFYRMTAGFLNGAGVEIEES